jgi:membrane protein required for colicin V production
MMGFSTLDWVVLLIIVLSVLQASAQGFFYEFFSMAGVIAGYLLAAWEYPRVAVWYAPHVNSPWAADIAAFFTIFVVVALLAGVLGRIARWAVHGVGLRWFDRLLGGVFGFVRGAVVATVIVLGLIVFAPQWGRLQQSRIAPLLLVSGRALIWAAPAELRQRFRTGWELLRTVPQHMSVQGGDGTRHL